MNMIELVFLFSMTIILYTYFGYPLALYLISLIMNNKINKKNIEPEITFLITAYNEEKHIREKIENTLNLDYPREKLEIIVASDASSDETDEIVNDYKNKGVILYRVEGRVGKTEVQNQAVKIAKGEIVIFSDADSMYDKFAITKIVRNFNDIKIGGVSGECRYINPHKKSIGFAVKIFWFYEIIIKKIQTKINTLTGVSGCIYAIRKELYVPLPKNIISDLVEPLKIFEKGYRVVYESKAIAYEKTRESSKKEFAMRVRVISRGMYGILNMKKLLNPFKYGLFSFQLFSHKVLRWIVSFFVISLFFSNFFLLGEKNYNIIFTIQVIFYLFAFLGMIYGFLDKKIKIFSIPLYFCIVNCASIIAFLKTIKGIKITVWETER